MILALLTFGFGLWQVFIQRDASSRVKFVFGMVAVGLSSVPLALQSAVLMVELVRSKRYFVKLVVHRFFMNILGDHGPSASLVANKHSRRAFGHYGDVGFWWKCVALVGHLFAKVLGRSAFGDAFSGMFHTRNVSTVVWLDQCRNVWGLQAGSAVGSKPVKVKMGAKLVHLRELAKRAVLTEGEALTAVRMLSKRLGLAELPDPTELWVKLEERAEPGELPEEPTALVDKWAMADLGQRAKLGPGVVTLADWMDLGYFDVRNLAVDLNDAEYENVRYVKRLWDTVLKPQWDKQGDRLWERQEMRVKQQNMWEMREVSSGREVWEQEDEGEVITPWFSEVFGSAWGIGELNDDFLEPVSEAASLLKNRVMSKVVRQVKIEASFHPVHDPEFGNSAISNPLACLPVKYRYRVSATGSQDGFMSTLYRESICDVCGEDDALEFCKLMEILDNDSFVVKSKPWRSAGNILLCEEWRVIVDSILRGHKKVNALKVPHAIFV